jgi:hypothetical protein
MSAMLSVKKLVSVGSVIEPKPPHDSLALGGPRHQELCDLLSIANGLYCFESALHVLPSGGAQMSLERWNAPDLWRDAYDDLAADCLFFAEDIFGNQFAIRNARIVSFDAETGDMEDVAATVYGWADRMLDEHEDLSGFPLAHRWQERNGAIVPGSRLVPKIPFVLGGEFAVDNLHSIQAVKGMRWRGDLAVQIRDLPDGASIELKVV